VAKRNSGQKVASKKKGDESRREVGMIERE